MGGGWDKALCYFALGGGGGLGSFLADGDNEGDGGSSEPVAAAAAAAAVWFVETDVLVYDAGVLRALDARYPPARFDAVTSVVRPYKEGGWHWGRWPQMGMPTPNLPVARLSHAMACVARVSARWLAAVRAYAAREGTLFFIEALLPSMVDHPPSDSSSDSESPSASRLAAPPQLETVTWRKAWHPRQLRRDHIYHPVKSARDQALFRQAMFLLTQPRASAGGAPPPPPLGLGAAAAGAAEDTWEEQHGVSVISLPEMNMQGRHGSSQLGTVRWNGHHPSVRACREACAANLGCRAAVFVDTRRAARAGCPLRFSCAFREDRAWEPAVVPEACRPAFTSVRKVSGEWAAVAARYKQAVIIQSAGKVDQAETRTPLPPTF
jgi:hypothetical protein